jgi:hypothetical protein
MFLEPVKSRTRRDACDFVVGKFESFDFRVDPSSRFGKLRRLFGAGDGQSGDIIPPDHPDYEIVLEGHRDLDVLAFVFDVLPDSFLGGHKDKLQVVLGGSAPGRLGDGIESLLLAFTRADLSMPDKDSAAVLTNFRKVFSNILAAYLAD